MRVLLPAALAVLAVGGACSSESSGSNQAPLGGAGSSSGGASASSGGRSSTGGSATATGGAIPIDCGFDAGTDACRVCLATHCCDDALSCFGDAMCEAAFTTYQSCEKDTQQVDKSKCYSTFFRTISSDSGSEPARTRLLTCIFTSCAECGGPNVL